MDINVKLDINKAGQFINEPVTMRTGESDNVIKASIFKDGTPYTGFKTATFNTTRSSGSVIANDPATVSGNTVSYSVAPSVTSSVGKLRNSYFLLNGKTSTESFEVAILPGVSADGDITDYVPGLSGLQDKWTKVSADWDTKIDGIKKEIENVSISDELKTAMNAAIDEAKAEYMATFNEAVKSIDDTAKSLQDKQTAAASELDKTIADAKAKGDSAADSVDSNIKSLNDKSKDIDTAVSAVNSKIADVNSFLANVQTSITAANSKFTSDQEASVKAVLDELKTQIENTKTDADSLDSQATDVKNKFDALKAQLDLAAQNISGVRTNLLLNSNFSSGLDNWRVNAGANRDCTAVVTTDSDGDTCVHITGTGESSGMWQTTVKLGQNQIATGSVLAKGIGKLSRAGFASAQNSNFGTVSTESYSKIGTTSQTVSGTNIFCIYFNPVNGVIDVYIKFAKLEKGPTATDYSLNPEDIATNDGVQTSIKNALGNYSTTAEVDSKISNLASKSDIPDVSGLAKQSDITVTGATLNGADVPIVDKKLNIITGDDTDTIEPGTVLYDAGDWHWDYTQKQLVFDKATDITKVEFDFDHLKNGIYVGLANIQALTKNDSGWAYTLLGNMIDGYNNFYGQLYGIWAVDPTTFDSNNVNCFIKIPKADMQRPAVLDTFIDAPSTAVSPENGDKTGNWNNVRAKLIAYDGMKSITVVNNDGSKSSATGYIASSKETSSCYFGFTFDYKNSKYSISRANLTLPLIGDPSDPTNAKTEDGKSIKTGSPTITQIIAY